jgi:hypothetical protein
VFCYIDYSQRPIANAFLMTLLTLDEANSPSHASMQVLSDLTKKNCYDEQLRKEESRKVAPRSHAVSPQVHSCLYNNKDFYIIFT